MKKKVTFHDIAQYTNVSKTTVSRYFNNPDSLMQETQQKIADALITLDYQENKVARILANGKTEFIGIITPNLFHQYYTRILNAILATYPEYGYKFIVFSGNDSAKEEKKYIQELLAYQVEGLIVLSHTLPSTELKELNLPIVSIEREDEFISSVNTNNSSGAVQAAQVLIDNECEVLFHINNHIDVSRPAYGRIAGFEKVCSQNGFPYEIVLEEFEDYYSDYIQKLTKIYRQIQQKYPAEKKGIFCSNDTIANALLSILIHEGKKIPEEYELIGFDNSPVSEQSIIPITTVSQNIDEMVSRAMQILTGQIHSQKHSKARPPVRSIEHIVVEPSLVLRETTSLQTGHPVSHKILFE